METEIEIQQPITDKDSKSLIKCIIKNNQPPQLNKEQQDFNKYNGKHGIRYSKLAVKCPYFKKNKTKMHLLPYFYCKKCNIEICDTCAFKHIHNNDINNIISKDSIIKEKEKTLYELVELYERTNNIFSEEEKNILKEKEKFKELNDFINKKLDIIEKDYIVRK